MDSMEISGYIFDWSKVMFAPAGTFLFFPLASGKKSRDFSLWVFRSVPACVSGFLICMDAKEAVYRVFPALAEIILFVLAFAAVGNMGREKMGKMDLPEVRIDLSFFEEFFYVPWRILHSSYLLYQGYFISISKSGCWRLGRAGV